MSISFTPLPTPQEMGEWDRYSIQEFGLHGELLMENASRELLHFLLNRQGSVHNRDILLFAGSGNNGGDAFALARHLHNQGANCTVLHSRGQNKYTGETAYHLQLAKKTAVNLLYLPEYNLDSLPQADIIVDGLLGTGFQGELREDYLNWIDKINKFTRAYKLAIDIPSGLNGYTGIPSPNAVRAHATVSLGSPKLGLFMPEASKFIGELHTPGIGIPAHIIEERPPECMGLNSNVFSYLPPTSPTEHKSNAGHVLVVGGSPGLTGAPTLTALGALKAGAGLCSVACPKQLTPNIKQGWPEIMTLPLGPGKFLVEASFAELRDSLPNFDAVVLGPGLGRQEGTGEFVHNFLQCRDRPPTLFDADGLYWLARNPKLLNYLRAEDILTPHPGEMARINRQEISELEEQRVDTARDFVNSYSGVLVLKGAATVLSRSQESIYVSPFACSNLAVGGSGDVLAGIIGSLQARKLDSLKAASLGVYWHAIAGKLLENEYPWRGNLAQDIAHYLPFALRAYKNITGED